MSSQPSETKVRTDSGRSFHLVAVLGLLLSIFAVGAVFLSPYLTGRNELPLGGDTKKYVWRSNLAIDGGLDSLTRTPQGSFWTNPDRPGFPALAALIHGTTGVAPLGLAYMVPAVMAVAVGLAAGAFAVGVLREPPWAFPIYAVAVGASVQIAGTATPVGYLDNLVVDALHAAAASAVVAAALGQPGLSAAIFLLAAAAVVHWPFSLVFAMVLLVLAIALVPESVFLARRGSPLIRTPTARVVAALGGSLLAGAGALALAPAFPSRQPRVPARKLVEKVAAFVPRFRLPVVGAAAVVGAGFLLRPADRARRWGMLLALIWGATGVAAIIAFELGILLPAYRVIGFGLGIPVLAAAALTGIAHFLWYRLRWAGAVVGVVLVGSGLGTGAVWAHEIFIDGKETISSDQVRELSTASRYLEATDDFRPVIFTTNRLSGRLGINIVRAGLPSHQLDRALVYLGEPSRLLAGRPTVFPGDPKLTSHSLDAWPDVREALPRNPIVLYLASLNHRSPVDGARLSPGIRVVRGPDPPAAFTRLAPPVPTPGELVGLSVAVLAVLGVAGSGWSFALMRGRWPVRVGLAPAFGIAALVLAGVVGNRLGAGLDAVTALVLAGSAALIGWLPLLARKLSRERAARRRTDAVGEAVPEDRSHRIAPPTS